MIHLPLFWVLDVTKMCDKRNIDHAISRHNPEAKKLYWLTTVVILSQMLKLIHVIWRFLDHFPSNIYGNNLPYSSKKVIIQHLCNLIPSLRQVMSKLYVYFKSKNERAMRRLNYSLFSLKKKFIKTSLH